MILNTMLVHLTFLKLNKSDFASFKKLWESMHFSYIHGARPEMFSKKEWIERLFVACYGFYDSF